ncbi:MAG: diaminopimelate epimerase [Desulfocapsa sp.]|uniref:Diaminopimelate epimerase n=1 Tax=Desulfotalea psychrophila TaxID=84980 RepID=A0ABS3AUL2_9BACT|nr:diaminopimelate epimerase [Desulfocapsa sp.]MBN4068205.1 diaminopimelate epimerase [Desulfotalea psychrophila]
MTIEFPVPFAKMSGTGNDFIVIDHRTSLVSPEEQPDFVNKVCRRMFSVGADGVIFIEASEKADFSWQFYNADGSVAEMCGNGARCAARFAYAKGIAGRKMSFETLAGIIEAEVLDDEDVSLLMTQPFDYRTDLTVDVDGKTHDLFFMNSGVPHAVLFMDEGAEIPVKKWGHDIRFHEMFQPTGTNVNFVQYLDDGGIRVRTYERGVEDETRACGTGAVAGAIFAAAGTKVESPVTVITSGGEALTIVFDLQEDGTAENVYLRGPARIIYIGQLTAEALQ